MYQLLTDGPLGAAQCIKRLADSAFIPFDDANTDFAEYKRWVEAGNEPLTALDGSSDVAADQPTETVSP